MSKVYDKNKLSKEQLDAFNKNQILKDDKNSGVGQNPGIYPIVDFAIGNRKLERGPESVIIQDQDPLYGQKKGGNLAGRVYLSSGLMGAALVPNTMLQNPIRVLDASSVEVSARTDPSENHGLVSITKNPYKARSAVSARGDIIQLIATEGGINLYAGGMAKYNSQGSLIDTAEGINLIFGNNIKDKHFTLEPIPKGLALQEFLIDLVDKVSELVSIVAKHHNEFLAFKSAAASHTHIANVPIPPSPDLAIYALASCTQDLTTITNNLAQNVNMSSLKSNYLQKYSNRYILSRWNKVN